MAALFLKPVWEQTKVAETETYHLLSGQPLYKQRFTKVLKYHSPGLAPVVDSSGAYHINMQGEALYPERYRQTFGYYNDRAAVENANGWFHIDTQGKRCYSQTYAWCGNFQENFCPVKDGKTQQYYHINIQGQHLYPAEYRYVGDYRDGIAVVCHKDGLQTHIDTKGNPLHNSWFLGLDVFHKGFARAQDDSGWFHIDKSGKALYPERYKIIEPFYNNHAVVEDYAGALFTIDPEGKQISLLRAANCNFLQELSADIVGFWKTQTIYAAVQLKLFDMLPNQITPIAHQVGLKLNICERLLNALQELNLVRQQQDRWVLTAKGELLKPSATSPMAAAALIWGKSHYQEWTKLTEKLYEPSLDTNAYFEALAEDKVELLAYQNALSGYANQDYQNVITAVDWQKHQTVIDAGGGTATLLHLLLQHYPHLQGILLEKPAVISLIANADYHPNCHYISFDLRNSWPCQADAIIFARVLHDWPDDQAIDLLKKAKASLVPKGKIYLIELLLDPKQKKGSLLDLNMLVMTGGRERSLQDWQQIIELAKLKLTRNQPLSPIVNLLELLPL